MKKVTDNESSVIINDEIFHENNLSEEISHHKNSAEIIDHLCDDNGSNLINTEEEADATSICSISSTYDISMNYDEKFIDKYYAQFILSKNHEDVSSRSEYDSAKIIVHCHKSIIFSLLSKKSKSFE